MLLNNHINRGLYSKGVYLSILADFTEFILAGESLSEKASVIISAGGLSHSSTAVFKTLEEDRGSLCIQQDQHHSIVFIRSVKHCNTLSH